MVYIFFLMLNINLLNISICIVYKNFFVCEKILVCKFVRFLLLKNINFYELVF